MKITFDQLISKPALRTFDKEIEGIGLVTITELSAKEAIDRFTEALDLQSGNAEESEHQAHLNKWACRMLKGSEASSEEIDSLAGNWSTDVIGLIYRAGINYAGSGEDVREQMEKN